MTDTTPLRIKRIEIEGLFGLYHHVIDLNLEDRATILHGPNGVGKTILLRMINALVTDGRKYFKTISFSKFMVELVDGRTILIEESVITTNNAGIPEMKFGSLRYTLKKSNGEEENLRNIYIISVVFSKLATHFIEEQRLFYCSKEINIKNQSVVKMASVLKSYAEDLHERIQNAITDYAQTSQELDRTLPQRLLNKTTQQIFTSEQLKQQFIELESKYLELREIGLLQETVTPAFDVAQLNNIDEAKRGMMTLYIEDTQQKLNVPDDFAQRIKLFLKIINRKFKHKQIKIDHEKGFVIEGNDQQELALDSLSSGEQHEIVLTYDLLFKVTPNSLVLIDEPELSLHISWQQYFLPDLLEIVKISNFDVIIATHSPFIIGSRRDLMVALEDKVQ